MEPEKTGLDACVRCGICTQACPLSQQSQNFPGPKLSGPDAERFRLAANASEPRGSDLCFGCQQCELSCPSGVKVARMNQSAKAARAGEAGLSLATRLMINSGTMNQVASPFSGIVNPTIRNPLVRRVMEGCIGITARRPFPEIHGARFRRWAGKRKRREGKAPGVNRQIAYYFGCFTDLNAPSLGKSAVRCLEGLDWEVVVPPQGCCGIPRIASGDMKGARRQAKKNSKLMGPVFESDLPVVFTSPSCGLALKREYRELFPEFAGRDYPRPDRFRDLFELIQNDPDLEEKVSRFQPVKGRAFYHAACHLKALGIGFPSVELLRRVPSLEVIFLDAGCCGLGGTFGFKKPYYSLSMSIAEGVQNAIRRVNPDYVLSECEMCRMQITHVTGLPAFHPLEILDRALTGS